MSAVKNSKSKKRASTKPTITKGKAAKPDAPVKAVTTKVSKAKGDAKSKRISALDAAAQVLKAASKPMRAGELITAMAEKGLWKSPGGKTPEATLYAAMMREARDKGRESRFKKIDRGQFAFND